MKTFLRFIRWALSLFRKQRDYSVVTAKDARRKAVTGALSGRELDAMWATWESQGVSKEGLLYADVLRRKRELGVKLSAQDSEAIKVADIRLAHGRSLPPITAKLRF